MAFRLDVFSTIAKRIKDKTGAETGKPTGSEAGTESPETKGEGDQAVRSSDERKEEPDIQKTEGGGSGESPVEEKSLAESPKKKPSPVPKGHLIPREAVEEFGLPEMSPHQKIKKRASYTGERSLVKFREEPDSSEASPHGDIPSPPEKDLWEPELPRETSDIGHEPVFEEEENRWADAGISPPVRKQAGTIQPEKEPEISRKPSKRKLASRSDMIIAGTGVGADRFGDPMAEDRRKTRYSESSDVGENRFLDKGQKGRIGGIPEQIPDHTRHQPKRPGTRLEHFSEESGLGAVVAPNDISEARSRMQKGSRTERFTEEAGLGITAAPDDISESKSRKREGTKTERFSEESGLGITAAPDSPAELGSRKRTGTRIETFSEEAGLGITAAPDDLAENGKRKRTGTKTERFAEEAGLGITSSPDEDIESEVRKRTGVKSERFHEKEGLGIKTQPNGPESEEGRVRTGVDSEWFWEDTGMGADRIHDEKGKQKVGKIIDVDDLKSARKKYRLMKK